ncbi:MAG: glutamine synthetase type III, partial [Eubacteriales bacterium]|nr:glutamine synthetase type III [Eubacteriales bacterium]
LADALYDNTRALDAAIPKETASTLERAKKYRNDVLPAMEMVRAFADQLETIVAKDYWPMPCYSELLFGV